MRVHNLITNGGAQRKNTMENQTIKNLVKRMTNEDCMNTLDGWMEENPTDERRSQLRKLYVLTRDKTFVEQGFYDEV